MLMISVGARDIVVDDFSRDTGYSYKETVLVNFGLPPHRAATS